MSETKLTTAYDFKGRIAIVTGAGSGIGRSMALGFAKAGAIVIVNDILGDRVEETISLITAEGGQAEAARADVSNEAEVNAFVAAVASRHGRIDILCNNAGIMDKVQLPADTPAEIWHKILATNLTGCFFVAHAVLPHMLAQKSGSIINTASAAGQRGGCAGLAYVASKHGVVGLTRSIAWMHSADGIRCNAICPGAIATNITGGLGLEAFDPAGMERAGPVMALARFGKPPGVAEAAFFLASDGAHFVNGAIIPVDGGWSAG